MSAEPGVSMAGCGPLTSQKWTNGFCGDHGRHTQVSWNYGNRVGWDVTDLKNAARLAGYQYETVEEKIGVDLFLLVMRSERWWNLIPPRQNPYQQSQQSLGTAAHLEAKKRRKIVGRIWKSSCGRWGQSGSAGSCQKCRSWEILERKINFNQLSQREKRTQ